jgi:hypothetical protein
MQFEDDQLVAKLDGLMERVVSWNTSSPSL